LGSTRLANLSDEAQLARRRHVAMATVPRAASPIVFGRRIPITPITIFSGRLPTLKRRGLTPQCGPPSASRGEDIATGTRRKWVCSRVVNEWLICISVDSRDCTIDIRQKAPCPQHGLRRIQAICCTKSSPTTDLRFQPVNLFDCATRESFCARAGGAKDLCDD